MTVAEAPPIRAKHQDHHGWYYHTISFSYDGPTTMFPDGSDEHGIMAQYTNMAAERRALLLAKRAGIQMIHEYSWTDGSLCMMVRSKEPYGYREFRAMLSDNRPKEVKFRAPRKRAKGGRVKGPVKERRVKVWVMAGDACPVDPYEISSTNLCSAKDRFELSREQWFELIRSRHDEAERFFARYHEARDKCKTCRPGQCACKECSEVLKIANHNRNAWVKSLSQSPV